MPVPEVLCNIDLEIAYSAGSSLQQLGASATNSPLSFLWELLEIPSGSAANVGIKGDFTDGIAVIQNPRLLIDAGVDGTYVLQCKATNASGTSDPAVDMADGQQNIIVLSKRAGFPIPNDFQYNWGKDYNNRTLRKIDENLPLDDQRDAMAGTSGSPSTTNPYATDADPRMSDPRTPLAHATSHKLGGGDAVRLDELADTTDIVALNSSVSAHGLLKKLSGNSTEYMNGAGNWTIPAGGGGGGFDREEEFTATVVDGSNRETYTLSASVAANVNTPSGRSVRVYVNGTKHKYTTPPNAAREFDIISATQIRVGGLVVGDNVEIVYGV